MLILPIKDSETNKILYLILLIKRIEKNLLKKKLHKDEEIKKLLNNNGIDMINFNTGHDYVKPLVNFSKKIKKK